MLLKVRTGTDYGAQKPELLGNGDSGMYPENHSRTYQRHLLSIKAVV